MSRREMKLAAKARMEQAGPEYLKMLLLWTVAAVLLPQVAMSFASGPMEAIGQLAGLVASGIDPEVALRMAALTSGQLMSAGALSIIVSLYQILMGFGLVLYLLRVYRDEPRGQESLFGGFGMAGRVLGANLLVDLIIGLVVSVAAVPLLAAGAMWVMGRNPASPEEALLLAFAMLSVWALVLVAVALAMALPFSLVNLALADEPELGVMGALRQSRLLMRGRKRRYLVLGLSFAGWAILAVIPASVLSFLLPGSWPEWVGSLAATVLLIPFCLWLAPYMHLSFAAFYEDAKRETLGPGGPAF